MTDQFTFYPPKRIGLLVQGSLVLALTALGLFGLWQASGAAVGPAFLIYLFPVLVGFIFIPVFSYRSYGLSNAVYILERDGVSLNWGLRHEEIPIDSVAWVRPASELQTRLPLPLLRWPGSVVGARKLNNETVIEYLASRVNGLILIATPGKIYAISPADPGGFLKTFQRLMELGSLHPIPARSVQPAILAVRLWDDRVARWLLVSAGLCSLALLAWVSLAIPLYSNISLRLAPDGTPVEMIPAVQLILLPVLNAILFTANLVLGVFFYRRKVNMPAPWHSEQTLSYLLWGSSLITSILFLGAVAFILGAA